MDETVTSVTQVADIMREITAASEAQSADIGEANRAIAQMDEMIQQNSALVEQASAALSSAATDAVPHAAALGRPRLVAIGARGEEWSEF